MIFFFKGENKILLCCVIFPVFQGDIFPLYREYLTQSHVYLLSPATAMKNFAEKIVEALDLLFRSPVGRATCELEAEKKRRMKGFLICYWMPLRWQTSTLDSASDYATNLSFEMSNIYAQWKQ